MASPLLQVSLAALSVAQLSAADTSCTGNLQDFVENSDALSQFVAGGNQTGAPIFFDIPRTQTPYKLCLENILLPTFIGDTACPFGVPDACYIMIGKHAEPNSQTANSDCASGDNLVPCYSCSCTGSVIPPVNSSEIPVNSCGISNTDDWATSCPSVSNLRENSTTTMSLEISSCPTGFQDCNYCAGGSQEPLRVSRVIFVRVAGWLVDKHSSKASFKSRLGCNGSRIFNNNAWTLPFLLRVALALEKDY